MINQSKPLLLCTSNNLSSYLVQAMEIGLSYFSKINYLCPQRPKSHFLPFSDPEVHDHNMECIERNTDGTDYGLNPGPQNSL